MSFSIDDLSIFSLVKIYSREFKNSLVKLWKRDLLRILLQISSLLHFFNVGEGRLHEGSFIIVALLIVSRSSVEIILFLEEQSSGLSNES